MTTGGVRPTKDDWFDWTPERVASLRNLWAVGGEMSAARIAELLGTTKNRVIGKVQRLQQADGAKIVRASPPVRTNQYGRGKRKARKTAAARSASKVSRLTGIRFPGKAKAPLPPRPLPPPRPDQAPVPLLERELGQCPWPVGEDERGLLVCGAPRAPGDTMCSWHRSEEARRAGRPPAATEEARAP